MKILLGWISARQRTAGRTPASALAADYLVRAGRLAAVEALRVDSEAALLAAGERSTGQGGRPAAHLVLFDSRGDRLTSEEFARWMGRLRDEGTQRLMLAIGPADGWSAAARARADRFLSLSAMTMPHELARAVAAEQVYRALTILAGHPYHCGH